MNNFAYINPSFSRQLRSTLTDWNRSKKEVAQQQNSQQKTNGFVSFLTRLFALPTTLLSCFQKSGPKRNAAQNKRLATYPVRRDTRALTNTIRSRAFADTIGFGGPQTAVCRI
ncbi:MAG TPA: hypothetical protein DCY07_03060 [Rhodospirillaceae bacterium]|nr:hypothetical protein [Rhodospirillaceae bacterium]